MRGSARVQQPANDNGALTRRYEDAVIQWLTEGAPETKLTVITNTAAEGYATKAISRSDDGTLLKRPAAGIYEGTFETVSFRGIEQFAEILDSLTSRQALAYGRAAVPQGRIVTQERLKAGAPADAIARDAEHFVFPEQEPAILMLDFDRAENAPAQDWPFLDRELTSLVPELKQVTRLWRPSASAFIYDAGSGAQITGAGNWRCYFVVDNAAAIPAIGAAIYAKYWQAGHGWIYISRSGMRLDRAPVDAAVWQAERLDFAASPVLSAGLVRKAPKAHLIEGELPCLFSSRLAGGMTLAEFRATSPEIAEARKAAAGEAARKRQAWIADRAPKLRAEGCSLGERELAKLLTDAVERLQLRPGFVLYPATGGSITVGEVLADRERWDGARFRDPIDPFGYNDARIAHVRVCDNRTILHTFGHGVLVFELVRETATIRIVPGERPAQVDTCIEVLRARGDLYERAGEIVRLCRDGVTPVSEAWLTDYFDRAIRFEKPGRDGVTRMNTPRQLINIVLAKKGERGLRELRGVITAPALRPDGSLLDGPGYDSATGLLLKAGRFSPVNLKPTHQDLRTAFATLWEPFKLFPFVTAHDQGVAVASVLTALVRRSLPSAPGFSFDAPTAGTGKTLLAQCVLSLMGAVPQVVPECREEEELRKRLLAALREGKPGLLLDNIRDVFGSSALEAFLTSEYYCDRVLGVSEMLSFPTDILLLISGNNFMPKGDLWRRLLTCRLDAKSDAPERRIFPFEPLDYCRRHRQDIVAAGLTLLLAFIDCGKPRGSADRLASFEAWDDLIRQCVIWLAAEQVADVADPAQCIAVAKELNPERQKLAAFLAAAHAVYGGKRFTVAELTAGCGFAPLAEAEARGTLDDAVREIASERGASINPRILGRWIERHAEVRVKGLRIVRCAKSLKSNSAVKWQIAAD